MKEWTERDIVEVMKLVSEVRPGSGETVRAMKLARRAIIWRMAMRWTLRGSVAAGIVVAVVLGVMTLTQQSATAAQRLVEATQKSKAFSGWVHEKMVTKGVPGYAACHFNNETGAWVSQFVDGDGAIEIDMYVPEQQTEMTYSSKSGEVRMGEMFAESAESWKSIISQSPLTVGEQLGKIDANVKETRDGALLKYEITSPKDDPKKAADEHRELRPEKSIIWADPETKLVKKGESNGAEVVEFEFTYGAPEVKDVFDLGVPRTAKVIDVRLTKGTRELFDRLARRYEQGFGDYVAVQTETGADASGKLDETVGAMSLYGQSGKSFVADRFLVGGKHGPRAADWPAPELKAALESLRARNASQALASDGVTTWYGYWFSADATRISKEDESSARHLKTMFDLPSKLWPTREKLGLGGTDAKAVIVHDEKRPTLIGLKVEQLIPETETKKALIVSEYWLDPAKDDCTVESNVQRYAAGDDHLLNSEFHHVYKNWTRTKSGRWFPAAWTETTRARGDKGMNADTTENRLEIWEGEKLEVKWFGEPKVGK